MHGILDAPAKLSTLGGSSSVTVKCILTTLYGPMNLGSSFLALPKGRARFFVTRWEHITYLPRQFMWCVCITWVAMMASCAAIAFHNACSANWCTPTNFMSVLRHCPNCGMCWKHNSCIYASIMWDLEVMWCVYIMESMHVALKCALTKNSTQRNSV